MSADDDVEIRNLLARVCHITDGYGSMEEYLTLWTEDCHWESPVAGTFDGHDGQIARHARYREAGVQGPDVDSFHLLTTVWVKLEGDTAQALSTWVLIVNAHREPRLQDLGNYIDTLRHTPQGWKLATRAVTQGSGEWLQRLPG